LTSTPARVKLAVMKLSSSNAMRPRAAIAVAERDGIACIACVAQACGLVQEAES
jgi:hypothetical protein